MSRPGKGWCCRIQPRPRPGTVGSPAGPVAPDILPIANGQLGPVPHQRYAQQQWLGHQLVPPPLLAELSGTQSQVGKAFRGPVDQSVHPEFLNEAVQLTRGRRPFLEIDEMRLYPPLGKKAEGFAGVGALLQTKDLNFHRRNLSAGALL